MSIEDMQRERKLAYRWVRGLPLDTIHAIVDALVLGDFDWREWLPSRPSSVFLNAVFTAAQHREESEASYA